jgi:hypothetical protein
MWFTRPDTVEYHTVSCNIQMLESDVTVGNWAKADITLFTQNHTLCGTPCIILLPFISSEVLLSDNFIVFLNLLLYDLFDDAMTS